MDGSLKQIKLSLNNSLKFSHCPSVLVLVSLRMTLDMIDLVVDLGRPTSTSDELIQEGLRCRALQG